MQSFEHQMVVDHRTMARLESGTSSYSFDNVRLRPSDPYVPSFTQRPFKTTNPFCPPDGG